MKRKIAHQFLLQYLIIFALSLLIMGLILLVLDFANHLLARDLAKNHYTAQDLLQDDYRNIDPAPVLASGGGVQVISSDYSVLMTAGINPLPEQPLTTESWTRFLTDSRRVGIPFSHSITYHEKAGYWLIVSFPTSFRIDLALVSNPDHASVDRPRVVGSLISILLLYLLLLSLTTFLYARLTAMTIVRPLRALIHGVRRLRSGDYTARVHLDLDNELGELQATFNTMAEQIETETGRRIKSEHQRKQLVLDISHDLKNPLASIQGYTELMQKQSSLDPDQQQQYLRIIQDNSQRANQLITGLFELSRLDSPEFKLDRQDMDVCEWLRTWLIPAIDRLDDAGYTYDLEIPDESIYAAWDPVQMSRVFANLLDNTLRYNQPGTHLTISLAKTDAAIPTATSLPGTADPPDRSGPMVNSDLPIHSSLSQAQHKDSYQVIQLVFADNGVGLPEELVETIFDPFVRSDSARNSQTGGTGLGLAIVRLIVEAHGGRIDLITAPDQGCRFIITMPGQS